MGGRRAPVLLYALYSSHFKVMFRVARLLADTGAFAPIVFFDRNTPSARDLDQARAAGIQCLGPDGAPAAAAPPPSSSSTAARAANLAGRVPASLRRRLGDLLSFATFAPQLGREIVAVHEERERARSILQTHSIELVVAPGDNVGYGTPALFREAHRLGIRVLVVPFTVSNRLEMVADLRRYRKFSAERIENRVVAALYPHWKLEHAGQRMVRESASRALALEWSGMAPPDPWVLNSGAADAIAVESPFMWDYYLRAGLPESRLRLTGTLGDDVVTRMLAEQDRRREALRTELGLAPGRKIVLFSYGEYHYFFQTGRPSEFSSQRELTDFWIESLRAMPGYDVVLSLHPSLDRTSVGHLADRGVKIATSPIEELIPLCDVYTASISATVRTAIACGKPVVDHDVFDFDYDNFVGLDAVWIAKTKAVFAGTLQRLATDETFFRSARSAQQALAPQFALLDGKCGERMLALIEELARGS